jgi:DnaJ like chaperone protein
MRIFNQLDKSNFSIEQVGAQVRRALSYPSRLQLVHFLFGLANSDRAISKEELTVIGRIATILGLHKTEFDSISTMFRAPTAESSYTILGITRTATSEEVKTAYRRLTLQYHPDKVAHHGEDVQRAAKEKYQKVVEAYETIKKERGII